MIHLVVFRAKGNAHDQILIDFLTNKLKVFQNKSILNHEWFEWGNVEDNGGLDGVFLSKKILLI
ncbi:hypothetical protein HMPREF1420_01215 [Helicobacter pylori GAM264Ai]|nr:hypothetical protein [Helicobacter pylori]EMH23863.1 hypothetical protein HMPREF1420_01215 [Helicobacter pylori GAM264Ai]EMH41566.1 hypothetical protein HMPREF1430_01119 [Helicobacter pylori GAM96Ai]